MKRSSEERKRPTKRGVLRALAAYVADYQLMQFARGAFPEIQASRTTTASDDSGVSTHIERRKTHRQDP